MTWIGTLALNGPLALGAYLASRHVFRLPAGLPRTCGTIVLAWSWATIGAQLLGALGWLALWPLAGWSSIGLVLALVLGWKDFRGPSEGPIGSTRPAARTWAWPDALALGLVLAPCVVLGTISLLGPVQVRSDGPIYHLYFAVRWWKAGALELVPVPFGENAATYFPANGDLWLTWLVVGWGGEQLAKVGQAPFLIAAGLASFGLARRLGAKATSSLIAVGWFVTSTPLLLFSFEPNVDTIFVAGYLLATYFLVLHARDQLGIAPIVLAGLAAGLAWGTKPTGTVFVPPLLLVGAVLVFAKAGATPRGRFAGTAALSLATATTCAFWFLRNAWLTGNPLYPLDLPAFGWVGWYGRSVMRNSPYYIPRAEWRAFVDVLFSVLDPRLALGWLLAVAGGWRFGRRGDRHDRWLWLCAGLAVLNVALYWWLVPYRTQQRFFLQALGLAAVPLAVLLDRSRLGQYAALGLLAAHVLTRQGWPFGRPLEEPPWDLVPFIPNAVGPPIPLPWWLVACVLIACVLMAMALCDAVTRPTGTRLALTTLALTAALTGWGTLWGFLSPTDPFFPPFRDFLSGWVELDRRAGARGARVAYAGTNIPYYLMGRGLRNRVRYVNVNDHPTWLMHDYHRQAIARGRPLWPDYPRPGWDRLDPDYHAWLNNLRADGAQFLVVTRVNPGEGPHNVFDAAGFPIERNWADSHPEAFQALYGEREGDPWFRLYRVQPESRRNP